MNLGYKYQLVWVSWPKIVSNCEFFLWNMKVQSASFGNEFSSASIIWVVVYATVYRTGVQLIIQNGSQNFVQNFCLDFHPHHAGKKDYFAHLVANNSRLVFLGVWFGVAAYVFNSWTCFHWFHRYFLNDYTAVINQYIVHVFLIMSVVIDFLI